MSNNRMPAAIAAESGSAPAASVVMMTHDDYLAKLQTDPYFRPFKPAASEPTPAKRPELLAPPRALPNTRSRIAA